LSIREQCITPVELPARNGGFTPTFEDDQNKPDIAQGKEALLPLERENVANRRTVHEPDGNLADQTGADDLRRDPLSDSEEEEKGQEDEDRDNCSFLTLASGLSACC
jgi:hypothetical protein